MQHPNDAPAAGSAGISPAVDRDQFTEALRAAGRSQQTVYVYWRALARLEAQLTATGTNLATCSAAQLIEVAVDLTAGRYNARRQLHGALAYALAQLGRPAVARAVKRHLFSEAKPSPANEPFPPAEAQLVEEAAWRRGGVHGLATLLALHTPLTMPAIAALRWEHFDVDLSELVQGETIPLAARFADAVAAQGNRYGWVFPSPTGGHLTFNTLWTHVANVLIEAGAQPNVRRLRRTPPAPNVNGPTVLTLRRTHHLAPSDAQLVEETAWQKGGFPGLATLLALHTPLTMPAIAALRWEHFDVNELTLADETVALAGRLGTAVAKAQGDRFGWVFAALREGHLSPNTLWRHVANVLIEAGVQPDVRRLRRTQPAPNVNGPTTLTLPPPRYLRSSTPGAAGISLDQLLGTGCALKTAKLHRTLLDQAAEKLAARGSDLMTCTSVDLAALAADIPPTSGVRGQLRGALTRGWEVLGRDPTPSLRAIRIPPHRRGRSRALGHDHATLLEQTAWARHDLPGLAVLIGLYAGLRRNEIATLRWERITWDDGRATWLRVTGKGDLVADVPVNRFLSDALSEHRQSGGWVFPGRFDHTHVAPATIWQWSKIVAAEAGIDDFTTHRLRHTALTEANDASGDLRTVQEIARHSRPEMTAIYTRVTGQRMHDVIDMVDYGRQSPDQPQPDPADHLPAIGYRQLVTMLHEEHGAAAWVDLGQLLSVAGWRFRVLDDFLVHWAHPTHPLLFATASTDRQGRPEYNLFLPGPPEKDWADTWSLSSPDQLLALAESIAAGAPAPQAHRLGGPDPHEAAPDRHPALSLVQ